MSIFVDKAAGELLSNFTLLINGLNLVKKSFTSRCLTLPKDHFIKKAADEAEDEEDMLHTLHYDWDILVTMNKVRPA